MSSEDDYSAEDDTTLAGEIDRAATGEFSALKARLKREWEAEKKAREAVDRVNHSMALSGKAIHESKEQHEAQIRDLTRQFLEDISDSWR